MNLRVTALELLARDEAPVEELSWHGLPIGIEFRGGEVRDVPGVPNVTLPASWVGYGYFIDLPASDGDSLDVILGPRWEDERLPVWLAVQLDPKTGDFFQYKTLLGFESEEEAKEAFLAMWPEKMLGGLEPVDNREFRKTVLPDLVDDGSAAGAADSSDRRATLTADPSPIHLHAMEVVAKALVGDTCPHCGAVMFESEIFGADDRWFHRCGPDDIGRLEVKAAALPAPPAGQRAVIEAVRHEFEYGLKEHDNKLELIDFNLPPDSGRPPAIRAKVKSFEEARSMAEMAMKETERGNIDDALTLASDAARMSWDPGGSVWEPFKTAISKASNEGVEIVDALKTGGYQLKVQNGVFELRGPFGGAQYFDANALKAKEGDTGKILRHLVWGPDATPDGAAQILQAFCAAWQVPMGPELAAKFAGQPKARTAAVLIENSDHLLDILGEILTPGESRARNERMRKTHLAGLSACELCGRPVKPGAEVVAGQTVGPECLKRLLAAGYTWTRTAAAAADDVLVWHDLRIVLEAEGGHRRPSGDRQQLPDEWRGLGYFEDLHDKNDPDEQELDVVVGPGDLDELVHLGIQLDDESRFRQFKCFLGFLDEAQAEAAFKLLWQADTFGGMWTVPAKRFRKLVLPRLTKEAAAGVALWRRGQPGESFGRWWTEDRSSAEHYPGSALYRMEVPTDPVLDIAADDAADDEKLFAAVRQGRDELEARARALRQNQQWHTILWRGGAPSEIAFAAARGSGTKWIRFLDDFEGHRTPTWLFVGPGTSGIPRRVAGALPRLSKAAVLSLEVDPARITPPHGVKNVAKKDRLVAAMRENGWDGRPLLVYRSGGGYQAITGSHRLSAAREAELARVPVLLIEDKDFSDATYTALDEADDNYDRLRALEELRKEQPSTQEAYELMAEEVLRKNDVSTTRRTSGLEKPACLERGPNSLRGHASMGCDSTDGDAGQIAHDAGIDVPNRSRTGRAVPSRSYAVSNERIANGSYTNGVLESDPLHRSAVTIRATDLLIVKDCQSRGGRAYLTEPAPNGLSRDAELGRDGFPRRAVSAQENSYFGVPAQSARKVVQPSMFAGGHHLEIAAPVIQPVSVSMVDQLVGAKGAAQDALHNHAVLEAPNTGCNTHLSIGGMRALQDIRAHDLTLAEKNKICRYVVQAQTIVQFQDLPVGARFFTLAGEKMVLRKVDDASVQVENTGEVKQVAPDELVMLIGKAAFTGEQREWRRGEEALHSSGERVRIIKKLERSGGGINGYIVRFVSGPRSEEQIAATPSALKPPDERWDTAKKGVVRLTAEQVLAIQNRLPPKRQLWNMLLEASGIEYPRDFVQADGRYERWKQQYAQHRLGPKPVYIGGETDGPNRALSLEGPNQVSGPFEAFERLTRNITTWDQFYGSQVLDVLREVPGLEKLHFPDEVYDRLVDRAWDEQEPEPNERPLSPAEEVELPAGATDFVARITAQQVLVGPNWNSGEEPPTQDAMPETEGLGPDGQPPISDGGLPTAPSAPNQTPGATTTPTESVAVKSMKLRNQELYERAMAAGGKEVKPGYLSLGNFGWVWSPAMFGTVKDPSEYKAVLDALEQRIVAYEQRPRGQDRPAGLTQVVGMRTVAEYESDIESFYEKRREAYLREGKQPGEKAVVVVRVPSALARMFPKEITEKNGPPHFTVVYIPGPHDDRAKRVLEEIVSRVAARHGPIPVEFEKGVEWFKSDNQKESAAPWVAHKGVHEKTLERMAALHWDIVDELEDAGFKPSVRDEFKAHATLAYCASEGDYNGPVPEGGFTADAVQLWGWPDTPSYRLSGRKTRITSDDVLEDKADTKRSAGRRRVKKRKPNRRRLVKPTWYLRAGGLEALDAAYGTDGDEVRMRDGARVLDLSEDSLKKNAARDPDVARLVEAVQQQADGIKSLTALVQELLGQKSGFDAVRTEDRLIVLNPNAVEKLPARRRWLVPPAPREPLGGTG